MKYKFLRKKPSVVMIEGFLLSLPCIFTKTINKTIMKTLPFLTLLLCCFTTQAQIQNDDVRKLHRMNNSNTRNEIRIPDFDGYKTLKCDFHIHTVFSDGKVWPDMSVLEAWQEGLDAIAITDLIIF